MLHDATVAELTSSVGALVLGVGLGALFLKWFAPAAGVIALAGVIAHAVSPRTPAAGPRARLMETPGVDAMGGRPPITRQKERPNGGVRMHRRS